MKGGQPNRPQPQPDPANLDDAELTSNQEAKVVPWFAGQRKFALTWISPVHNQFSKDVPTSGKK